MGCGNMSFNAFNSTKIYIKSRWYNLVMPGPFNNKLFNKNIKLRI